MKLFNEKHEAIACPLCCCIRLNHGYVAYVDPEDWVSLNRRGWKAVHAMSNIYAFKVFRRQKKTHEARMHRLIMNTPLDQVCHHKNRSSLDNRKANLENMADLKHRHLPHKYPKQRKNELKTRGPTL